jgi:alcohol dehydrogenase (cytochrome c)
MTSEKSSKNWPWLVAIAGVGLLAFTLFVEDGQKNGAMAQQVTNERLMNTYKEPENWITHHGSYSAHRFSGLHEITSKNVSKLQVTGTVALGGIEAGGIWPFAGYEGTPLVEDGYLYLPDGWGTVYKYDVRKGVPTLVWKYDPEIDRDWAGNVTCCGVNNRGVALWKDKIVSHVLDGRLLVIDKASGELLWERTIADPDKSETITGAPLVVKNLAITGVAGGEYGIRGWLAATDLETGKEVWRRHTIPGPGEPGHETWKDDHEAWKTGGGPTWVTGSYDAELNLIYWGVGNPGPDWDNAYRPGDNLYTESVLALDATTGEIKWHFQYTPNDPYDYDSVSEHILVDLENAKGASKLAFHANRNGYLYALDRTNGKFQWATQFVKKVTWTKGLDPKTGRPNSYDPNVDVQKYEPGTAPTREDKTGRTCPGNMGGKNWPPMAYNPDRKVVYIPVIESCNQIDNQPVEPGSWKVRDWFTGGGPSQFQPITGSVTAIDVTTGKVVAKQETKYPMLGGVLATAGDVVFVGYPEGAFVALDGKTLEELWRFETGAGINAPPITYEVDGKQYVAVAVGLGGAWPKWFIDGTKGLEDINPGSMLFIFALK